MKLKNIDHLVITTANLEDAGCEIVEGVVEQAGALGLMDSIYMHDPDGSLVEVAVYREA